VEYSPVLLSPDFLSHKMLNPAISFIRDKVVRIN
jgi:hypothetical protein